AGGAASMGIKAGMQGASYANEDIAVDAVTTLATAATAGLVQAPALQGALQGVVGVAGEGGATIAQTMAMEAMRGGLMGASSGLVSGALDERTWRGPGNGLENFLHTFGTAAVGGAVTGGLQGGTQAAFGDAARMGLSRSAWGALAGAGGGTVGGLAQTV